MITSNRCRFDFAENKKAQVVLKNQSKTTWADMKKETMIMQSSLYFLEITTIKNYEDVSCRDVVIML